MSALSQLFKKNNKPAPGDKSPDVEEDGFVVIGKTEDEKTILTPSNPEYHKDVPPTYQNYQVTSQAAKQETCNNKQSLSPVNHNKDITNETTIASSNERSCIDDIPFHFSASVDPALNYGKLNIDIGDLSTELNTSNYEYDFKTEIEVLQNMF